MEHLDTQTRTDTHLFVLPDMSCFFGLLGWRLATADIEHAGDHLHTTQPDIVKKNHILEAKPVISDEATGVHSIQVPTRLAVLERPLEKTIENCMHGLFTLMIHDVLSESIAKNTDS